MFIHKNKGVIYENVGPPRATASAPGMPGCSDLQKSRSFS